MSGLRRDIAAAEARMRVTFGTRTAVRNLHESLEDGESVQEMLACTYAGSDGILVLTDRRVIAIRDDFSRFRLQAVPLSEAKAVDYGPTVHDGLAVLTPAGRVAVRRMNREDGDRFVAALTTRLPDLVVATSTPKRRGPVTVAHGPSRYAPPPAAHDPAAEPTRPPSPAPGVTAPATVPAAAPAAPDTGPVPPPASTPEPGSPDPLASSDKEVLMGVLADLHAKGVLTADEFAAKIHQVATRP